jgi:hypothetical protein
MRPHVRQLLFAVGSVLAFAAVCAVSWSPRPEAAARGAEVERPIGLPSTSVAPVPPPPAVPSRNVFEFADRPPAPALESLPPVVAPPPLAPAFDPTPDASPVRLAGFVRRGGIVRAALTLNGILAVLGVGEESDGYVVLAIDEDAGVTLRTPEGSQLVLTPSAP